MQEDDLLNLELEKEKRLSEIENQLEIIQTELHSLRESIKDLILAWQAASWVVSIVKGIGALSVAIAAAYALFTGKH